MKLSIKLTRVASKICNLVASKDSEKLNLPLCDEEALNKNCAETVLRLETINCSSESPDKIQDCFENALRNLAPDDHRNSVYLAPSIVKSINLREIKQ